jgi:hypothetical protein
MKRPASLLFLAAMCAVTMGRLGLVWGQIESINTGFQVSFSGPISTSVANGSVSLSNLNTRIVDVNPIPNVGSLSYPAITPGRYRLDVQGNNIKPVSQEVTVHSNDSQEVNIPLHPAKASSSPPSPPTPPQTGGNADDRRAENKPAAGGGSPPIGRISYLGTVITCPRLSSDETCVLTNDLGAVAEAMDNAAEDLRRSYELSREVSEASNELLEGKEVIFVAEGAISRRLRSKIVEKELELIDNAILRIHLNLVDLVHGSQPHNGWSFPISPFSWDSPGTLAQKARAVVDDGIWAGQLAKEARKEVRSTPVVSTSTVNVADHPRHWLVTCAELYSCSQLTHVSLHGWTNQ